jgi:hypothetical protein
MPTRWQPFCQLDSYLSHDVSTVPGGDPTCASFRPLLVQDRAPAALALVGSELSQPLVFSSTPKRRSFSHPGSRYNQDLLIRNDWRGVDVEELA